MNNLRWLLVLLIQFLSSVAVAQIGDAGAGRQTYNLNCARCHGVTPDGNALSAANSASQVAAAINSVSGMQFMIGVFSQTTLNDLAAFLGNPNVAAVTEYSLTIEITGAGANGGMVSSQPFGLVCGSICTGRFVATTLVTLQAVGSRDTPFQGWSGGCSGTAPTCVVAMSKATTVIANFALAGADTPINYSDMWWADDTESGWGLAISQHQPSNMQFNTFYVYEVDGSPTWYVMPGGSWNENFTVFSGRLFRPTGARLDKFVAGNVAVGNAVGDAMLTFTSASTATFNYTISGISATKKIERQVFGVADTTPSLAVGDLWWGGAMQSGWGITIVQQNRTLFAVWYTYNEVCSAVNSGCLATWYVMPGGSWGTTPATINTYSGTLYSAAGPRWLGVDFDKNAVKLTAVGSVSFGFMPDAAVLVPGKSSNATLTYQFNAGPFAGTTQTKQITRQAF